MTQPPGRGAGGGSEGAYRALVGLVMAATVRIHRPEPGYAPDGSDRGFLGSGFFIAPSWVLTCAHVAMEGEGRHVNVVFKPDPGSAETAVEGTVVAALPEKPARRVRGGRLARARPRAHPAAAARRALLYVRHRAPGGHVRRRLGPLRRLRPTAGRGS